MTNAEKAGGDCHLPEVAMAQTCRLQHVSKRITHHRLLTNSETAQDPTAV